MYGIWYDNVKPKHEEKTNLCYMDRGSFVIYIKIGYTCVDIVSVMEILPTTI